MASSSDDSGLLGSALATLDIPTTARLAGISMNTDDDGTTKWTVTFVDKPSYHVINKHTNHTPVVQPVVKPHNGELHRLFPLRCDAKTYAWGRKGEASLVATLKRSTDSDFEVGEETPYAELWMGTHPSGPSLVTLQEPWHTTTPLAEMLKLNPQLSGGTPKTGLPYLFKILSVRTALSIQAHPDKALARKLHAKRPDMYKDDNHKPEMAIAISKFEALCSFREASQILSNCESCPELTAVVGEATVGALRSALARDAARRGTGVKQALRDLFSALMSAEAGAMEASCKALAARLARLPAGQKSGDDELAQRLYAQYPDDVGVFCVYLLNYIVLQPGEALYLGANEPHAYIAGECAEAMATSDNVVRAGCTPKFKDVDTLCSMLTYSDGAPHRVEPEPVGDNAWRYSDYPAEEFMVDKVEVEPGAAAVLPSTPGVSILIICAGEAYIEERVEPDDSPWDPGSAQVVGAGSVFMVCPDTSLRLQATGLGKQSAVARGGKLLAFRACAKDAAWRRNSMIFS